MSLRQLCGGKLPRAILFDLDGTLIDSVPDLALAIDAMLGDFALPPAGEARTRDWVGNGAQVLVERSLAWAKGLDSKRPVPDVAAALPVFFTHYQAWCAQRTVLVPGVLECLQAWHAEGVLLACVTNKPERFTLPILRHFGLLELMPVVLSGDSLAVKKPDPEPLYEALRQLNIAATEAVMLGDSRNDVRAARAAGMAVACVSFGYNHGVPISQEAPDLIVDHFAALRA